MPVSKLTDRASWVPLARLLPVGVGQPTRSVHARLESIVSQLDPPHGALGPYAALFVVPGTADRTVTVWFGNRWTGASRTADRADPDRPFRAPELAAGSVATPRSDVYSLGPLARMLWTGRHASVAVKASPAVPPETASMFGRPWRPPDADGVPHPALPDGFEAWCARCTAHDPEARFTNPGEALSALAALPPFVPPWVVPARHWAARLAAAGAVGPLAPHVDPERGEVVIGPVRWRLLEDHVGGARAPLFDDMVAVARLLHGKPCGGAGSDVALHATLAEAFGDAMEPAPVVLEGDELVAREVSWGWPNVIGQGYCYFVFARIAQASLPAERPVLAALVSLLARASFYRAPGPQPPCRFCGTQSREAMEAGDHCGTCAVHWRGVVF